MSTEVKQFLHAWCGKQKTSPNYELRAAGSKIRQRFMCEVGIWHIC